MSQNTRPRRFKQKGARSLNAVFAQGAASLDRLTSGAGFVPFATKMEEAMPSHNRRDPRLPILQPVQSKDSLDVIMERARKKLGVPNKWEKYGQNAVSAAEKADPEKSECPALS